MHRHQHPFISHAGAFHIHTAFAKRLRDLCRAFSRSEIFLGRLRTPGFQQGLPLEFGRYVWYEEMRWRTWKIMKNYIEDQHEFIMAVWHITFWLMVSPLWKVFPTGKNMFQSTNRQFIKHVRMQHHVSLAGRKLDGMAQIQGDFPPLAQIWASGHSRL